MNITVAICTWNRARLLDQTLDQLGRLEVPAEVEWELLVVNNNCTDDTDEVIARRARTLPLRRLFEPRLGKSHAANLAIANAAGDLILWTDDDVLVEPGWLAAHTEAARRWPEAAFFGGPIEPWFAVEPPRWIQRHLSEFQEPYAIAQHGASDLPISRDGWYPAGANLAFRADVLRRFRFDPELGPIGAELRRYEEGFLLAHLLEIGYQGVYVGGARVRHYIPAERLTQRYLWNWYRWKFRIWARREKAAGKRWPRFLFARYLKALAKFYVFTPFRGSHWLHAFFSAATWRGTIDEVGGGLLSWRGKAATPACSSSE